MSAAAPEKVIKNAAATAACRAHKGAQGLFKVDAAAKSAAAKSAGTAARAAARAEGGMAELVVLLPFGGIAEDFVGLGNLLELFLGGFVAGVFIGMIFNGHFAVGLFDLIRRGAFGDAEQFVVVLFSRHYSDSFSSAGPLETTTCAARRSFSPSL